MNKTAIAGIGASEQGKVLGSTSHTLAVEAFKRALQDSGLQKSDIDGLLTMPGTTTPEGAWNYLRVGETLGINPRFTGSMMLGGATAGASVSGSNATAGTIENGVAAQANVGYAMSGIASSETGLVFLQIS